MPDRDRAARHDPPTVRSVHHRIYSAPPTAPLVIPYVPSSSFPFFTPPPSLHPLVASPSPHHLSISPSPLYLPVISVIPPSSLHSLVTSSSPRHLHISPSPLHPLSPLRSPVTSAFPHHPCIPPPLLRPFVIPAEAGIHRTITHAEHHPTGGHNTTRSTAQRNTSRGGRMRWQSCNRAQSIAGSGSSPLRSVPELIEESKGVETGGPQISHPKIRFRPSPLRSTVGIPDQGGHGPLGTPGT